MGRQPVVTWCGWRALRPRRSPPRPPSVRVSVHGCVRPPPPPLLLWPGPVLPRPKNITDGFCPPRHAHAGLHLSLAGAQAGAPLRIPAGVRGGRGGRGRRGRRLVWPCGWSRLTPGPAGPATPCWTRTAGLAVRGLPRQGSGGPPWRRPLLSPPPCRWRWPWFMTRPPSLGRELIALHPSPPHRPRRPWRGERGVRLRRPGRPPARHQGGSTDTLALPAPHWCALGGGSVIRHVRLYAFTPAAAVHAATQRRPHHRRTAATLTLTAPRHATHPAPAILRVWPARPPRPAAPPCRTVCLWAVRAVGSTGTSSTR